MATSPRSGSNEKLKIKFRKTMNFDYKYKLPNNPYKKIENCILASSLVAIGRKNENKKLSIG